MSVQLMDSKAKITTKLETAIKVESITNIIKQSLAIVKDFPKAGINFIDISPLLANPTAWQLCIDTLANRYLQQHLKIDAILGLESRGFIFAAALAYRLAKPLIMIRKPGKLPGKTIEANYSKEYGQDHLQIQVNRIQPDQKVLIIDDILATGGTVNAAIELVKLAGGQIVEVCTVIEIIGIPGKININAPVYSILQEQ